MFDDCYEIVVDDLPERPVRRAEIAIGLSVSPSGSVTVVFDADRGEFVRVPGPPPGMGTLIALSPDGTEVVLTGKLFDKLADGFCLQSLATGEQRWFSMLVDGRDSLAALSPDGATIATLGDGWQDARRSDDHDGNIAVLSVVDVETAHRRRLWAGPGAMVAESGVGFSPDGQLVAASYLVDGNQDDDREDESRIVIVDMSGRVVRHLHNFYLLSARNGSWLTDRHLVCCHDTLDDMRLGIVDVVTGSWRDLARWTAPCAWITEGLIIRRRGPMGSPDGLFLTNLTGTDSRPFITTPGPYTIVTVEIPSSARPKAAAIQADARTH